MSDSNKLNKQQREAVGLLSIGTFLEYFDLMLYVHMAVLLNELFFPKTDPFTASLISAFSFCSTFVFRPLGALIFGYIGDTIGRKTTIIITTFLMAISCLVMANLPTYAQIGITASWIITVCRMVQGMSSMGEIVGAELYLTEMIKPPKQYFIVTMVAVVSVFGTVVALAVASLVTSFSFEWRLAFWVGAGVALIGSVARTSLRETPDFINAKREITNRLESVVDKDAIEQDVFMQTKIDTKTTLSLFLINCGWPGCFYFAYVHCGNVLKQNFGFSSEEVIHHNLIVAIIQLLGFLCTAWLSLKIHPFKIIRTKFYIFLLLILISPYLLSEINSSLGLLLFQAFLVLFACESHPGVPIYFKHFPVFKRYTQASMSYAVSRAAMYIITSFGLVYLIKYFEHWGLVVLMLPISIGFMVGVNYFQSLEDGMKQSAHSKTVSDQLKLKQNPVES